MGRALLYDFFKQASRSMTEDWKVNLQSGLDDWEGKIY